MAIFAAFALINSLFVTDTVKKFAASFLGETFVKAAYRLLFTCFSLATVLIAFGLIAGIPDQKIVVFPLWATLVFHGMQVLGIIIGALTFRVINFLEFLGITQFITYLRYRTVSGDIEGMRENRLISSGVYGVVRHPLYLAGMVIFTFNPHITVNSLTVTVLADLYFIVGSLIEQRRLKKRFGKEYEDYMKRVPAFMPLLKRKEQER